MKKQNLLAIVGTVAIVANLIIPGLAFGQTTDNQGGTLQINCENSPTEASSFVAAPADVTFADVTPNGSTTLSAWDATANTQLIGGNQGADTTIDGTQITNDHLIRVEDNTSNGTENCYSQWSIQAIMSSTATGGTPAMTKTGAADTSARYNHIPASTIKLVTTANVNVTSIDTPEVPTFHAGEDVGTQGVLYARDLLNDLGNDYDVVAPLYSSSTGSFNTNAEFDAVTGNSLETSRYVLGTCADGTESGKGAEVFADVYTGVALGIDDGVAANQSNGQYVGTITYTFANAFLPAETTACIPG